MIEQTMPSATTVYYNGACPICRAEIEHYRRLASREGASYAWRDVAAHPEVLRHLGIDQDTVFRRLHAIDGQGRLLTGIDAFIVVWRGLGRYRPLGRLAALPAVKPAAHALYERVLAPFLYRRHRRRMAKAVALGDRKR